MENLVIKLKGCVKIVSFVLCVVAVAGILLESSAKARRYEPERNVEWIVKALSIKDAVQILSYENVPAGEFVTDSYGERLADIRGYYDRISDDLGDKCSRTTVFAGDSITAAFTLYGVLDKIDIRGKKKIAASIGLNTETFRTKQILNGKSALECVIEEKPYRVYIMLGINDLLYRKEGELVGSYRKIIECIQSASPETDIVMMAIPPVTAAEKKNNPGFAQIPDCNEALKELAEDKNVRYFDCTDFLKDSTGWLKESYSADGIHWNSFVYDEYAKLLEEYDKSLDR